MEPYSIDDQCSPSERNKTTDYCRTVPLSSAHKSSGWVFQTAQFNSEG